MRYPIKVFYSEEDKGFIAVISDLQDVRHSEKQRKEPLEK